jgi:hypothetical protein
MITVGIEQQYYKVLLLTLVKDMEKTPQVVPEAVVVEMEAVVEEPQ